MAKKKATKKTAKTEAKKVFVTNSGKRYDIIGEQGKYWLCEGTQFRKASNLGHVEEIEIPVEIEEADAFVEDTPAEEATEPQDETGETDAE